MKDFTFGKVAENFDNHIDQSIRGYKDLVSDILNYSDYFVENDTSIVDIGSTTGRVLRLLKDRHNNNFKNLKFEGYEIEEKFHKDCNYKDIDVFSDVKDWRSKNVSFCTSIFTLQFISYQDRLGILKDVYKNLRAGGVFIYSEKVVLKEPFNEIMQDMFIEGKRSHFSSKDILDKNISLRKIMRLLSRQDHIQLLKNAGFEDIEVFWQNSRFVGFICIKGRV